jgi:hypothetical protein
MKGEGYNSNSIKINRLAIKKYAKDVQIQVEKA